MELKALIFDVDGTLAETEEYHRLAFNESFAAVKLPWAWSPELYAKLLEVTGGKERIAHYLQSNPATPLTTEQIAALHADKTARYTARIAAGGLSLRPGIATLIAQAQAAGLRLAIATTTSRPNVDALLKAALHPHPFEVIAAGDEVPAKKPAPDIYTLALHRLNLPPDACIALEDTPNGLNSARAAGLRCIITPSLYGGTGPFPGALAIMDPVGSLESIRQALLF